MNKLKDNPVAQPEKENKSENENPISMEPEVIIGDGKRLKTLYQSRSQEADLSIQGLEIPEKGVLLIISKVIKAGDQSVPIMNSLYVPDVRIITDNQGQPLLWGNHINYMNMQKQNGGD